MVHTIFQSATQVLLQLHGLFWLIAVKDLVLMNLLFSLNEKLMKKLCSGFNVNIQLLAVFPGENISDQRSNPKIFMVLYKLKTYWSSLLDAHFPLRNKPNPSSVEASCQLSHLNLNVI